MRASGKMKITKRQLRRIIREAIDPREMEEPIGGWIGNALHNDPDYRHHTDTDHFKIGDLVRSVDFEGDGWGGDYERSVGDQIGTVIEITPDQDGTQYTVHFPDGSTVMDTPSEFELVNEAYDNDADEWYEYRHGADQEDMEYYIAVSLENAARANSGVDGQSLLRIARQDPEYSSVLQGVSDERMWEVADTMIEDETLFFDVEEDAWYYAPEMR